MKPHFPLLVSTLLLAGHAAEVGAQEFQVHPSTQDPSVRVTLDKLAVWEDELSNWGRWGPDDQLGTLNLITPEKTRQAASLVRDGVSVSLAHFVTEEEAMDSQTFGADRALDDVGRPGHGAAALRAGCHQLLAPRRDALAPGRPLPLPDRDRRRVRDLQRIPAEPRRGRVQGSGDRQDGRRLRDPGASWSTCRCFVGLDFLDPSTPIYVSDLEEWEEFAGVRVSPGDVLIVRTGTLGHAGGGGAPGRTGKEAPVSTLRSSPGCTNAGWPFSWETPSTTCSPRASRESTAPSTSSRRSTSVCPWSTTATRRTRRGKLRVCSAGSSWCPGRFPEIVGGTAAPFNAVATF